MKIFITGATGFIGKHLVKKLISEGHLVTINLRKGKKSPFGDNVGTYYIGVQNIEDDIQFFKKESFDGIIHLASLYITNHKPYDINNLIDSNVKFGTYVLECAAQANIPWFLNTGTFWQHYQNKDYSPVNLYAATKQAFEDIARYYIETDQIYFCTIKLSDTFGPNDTRPKIFNLWKQVALTGETLDMSPGNQLIDILYIDDVVSAYSILADKLQNDKHEIVNGSVFAVSAQKRYSLKELSKIFESSTGFKLNINWGARPYREREVMIPWDKGKYISGWVPKFDLKHAIKKDFYSNVKSDHD